MQQRPLARPIGPDGMYILTYHEPHDYTADELPRALARSMPDVPRHLDDQEILDALARDAKTPPEERATPSADTISAFQRRLASDGNFGRLAKIHTQDTPAKPAIRKLVPRKWNANQAVAALSQQLDVLPPKAGRRTVTLFLREWTQARRPLPARDDPTILSRHNVWRKLLIKENIFPADDIRKAERRARAAAPRPRKAPKSAVAQQRPAELAPNPHGITPMRFTSTGT